MITSSRPVCARARRMASIVDSEPEFVKRHLGMPQRRASSSATTTLSSVIAAKWVPSGMRSATARVIAGWAWPCTIEPKPLWKSRYSEPSTSQTFEPTPRSRKIGCGLRAWYEDATPIGMTLRERSYMRAEPLVSEFRCASSRSVS